MQIRAKAQTPNFQPFTLSKNVKQPQHIGNQVSTMMDRNKPAATKPGKIGFSGFERQGSTYCWRMDGNFELRSKRRVQVLWGYSKGIGTLEHTSKPDVFIGCFRRLKKDGYLPHGWKGVDSITFFKVQYAEAPQLDIPLLTMYKTRPDYHQKFMDGPEWQFMRDLTDDYYANAAPSGLDLDPSSATVDFTFKLRPGIDVQDWKAQGPFRSRQQIIAYLMCLAAQDPAPGLLLHIQMKLEEAYPQFHKKA